MKKAAFSLIEMSIVLLILSLVAAGALTVGQSSALRTEYETSDERLNEVVDALKYFYATHGRLPCPAQSNLKLGDAAYGREILSGACNNATAVTGVTRVETSGGSGIWVRIGTLPTRDLMMYDDFDGRFTYAVVQGLTDSAAVGSASGAITVNDGTGTNIATDAAFVVVSHGKDGKGAFQLSGVAKACGTSTNLDVENCDADTIFTDTDFSRGDVAATFFDDRIRWMNKTNFELAVDDLKGGGACVGAAEAKVKDTEYTAATDGIVTFYVGSQAAAEAYGCRSATTIGTCYNTAAMMARAQEYQSSSFPVKAGENWVVEDRGGVGNVIVFWTPLTCGGGGGALDVSWHTDTHAGGSSKEFICPSGKKLLSAKTLLVPSGSNVCGNSVNADNTGVIWGGCNVVSGQQYRLEASCGSGGGDGGSGSGGGVSLAAAMGLNDSVWPDYIFCPRTPDGLQLMMQISSLQTNGNVAYVTDASEGTKWYKIFNSAGAHAIQADMGAACDFESLSEICATGRCVFGSGSSGGGTGGNTVITAADIAAGAFTAASAFVPNFNTTVTDTLGGADLANDAINITQTGSYLLQAKAEFCPQTTHYAMLTILRNGTELTRNITPVAGGCRSNVIAEVHDFSSGDVLKMQLFDSVNGPTLGIRAIRFAVTKIGG